MDGWKKYFQGISTHALREEGDLLNLAFLCAHSAFLPTPSARRATHLMLVESVEITISTHALREEGDLKGTYRKRAGSISTHALREEGDCRRSCAGRSP